MKSLYLFLGVTYLGNTALSWMSENRPKYAFENSSRGLTFKDQLSSDVIKDILLKQDRKKTFAVEFFLSNSPDFKPLALLG